MILGIKLPNIPSLKTEDSISIMKLLNSSIDEIKNAGYTWLICVCGSMFGGPSQISKWM
jgi:hypothetical protein